MRTTTWCVHRIRYNGLPRPDELNTNRYVIGLQQQEQALRVRCRDGC
jgi:hypothetical protein